MQQKSTQNKGRLTAPFVLSALAELLLLLLLLLRGGFRSSGSAALFGCGRLHRQLDAAAVGGFENLDANDLAFLDVVFDLVDAFLGDLGDVQQTILARQHGNDRTEVEDLEHGTFVDLANLDFRRNRIDTRTSGSSSLAAGSSDGDRA